MHILIGTDGSQHATDAATAGVALLGTPDRITLACVIEAPPEATRGMESGFAGGIASDAEVDAAWSALRDEARQILEHLVDEIDVSVPVDLVTLEGDPGAALCQAAADRDADVVVVGSRGRGVLKRALLGSVSTYVTNNAPCPVLVTRVGMSDT